MLIVRFVKSHSHLSIKISNCCYMILLSFYYFFPKFFQNLKINTFLSKNNLTKQYHSLCPYVRVNNEKVRTKACRFRSY